MYTVLHLHVHVCIHTVTVSLLKCKENVMTLSVNESIPCEKQATCMYMYVGV